MADFTLEARLRDAEREVASLRRRLAGPPAPMSEKTEVMRWRRLLFEAGVREETLDELGKLTLTVPEVYALASVLDRAREVDLGMVMEVVTALASKQGYLAKLAADIESARAAAEPMTIMAGAKDG